MNHPSDNPETCCPVCWGNGELSFDEVAKAKADALALWAVRVLDAFAAAHENRPPTPSPKNYGNGCFEVWMCDGPRFGHSRCYVGDTPDAARLAAADAIAPELGDRCPRRPA